MAEEIERILYHAEDFLRRNVLRPASAREAKKRRARRRMEEMLRRLRRAGLILAGLLAALVVTSILGHVGLLTWLFALPTIVLVSLLSLSFPARRRRVATAAAGSGESRSLAEMAVRVEEGLMDRSAELPARALPSVDAIVARLGELQPHLVALAPGSVEEGEARRLICNHLPRLLDTYLALPRSERAPYSENSRRLGDGLGLVAEELDHLLETCCRDRQLSFETQHRFLETRYRQDPKLSGR